MCHNEITYFCELKHSLLFLVFSCQAARISSALEKVGTWRRGVKPVISWKGNLQRLLGEYIREDNKGDGEHPRGSPEDNAHFFS